MTESNGNNSCAHENQKKAQNRSSALIFFTPKEN